MNNALENSPLAHHEAGNRYCPYCDRLDAGYPKPCECGGLIHRDADGDGQEIDRYAEICDGCGALEGADKVYI